MIHLGSGHFEYNVDDEIVLSGQISSLHDKTFNLQLEKSTYLDMASDDFLGSVFNDEIYTVLENSGLNLGDKFKNIIKFEMNTKNIQGYIKWTNDWIYFLDGLLKFPLLQNLGTSNVEAPIYIRQLSIIPAMFKSNTEKGTSKKLTGIRSITYCILCTIKYNIILIRHFFFPDIYVDYNIVTKEITCNGVKITDVKYNSLKFPRHKSFVVTLEEQTFIQFNHSKCKVNI